MRAAVNARLEHAAWLRRTSVDRELPKAERKQLLVEASDQIKALDTVELPQLDAAMVTPDAHAALFASLTGLKTEQVQLSFAIFTAVLAIFAMSIAYFFAAVFWARAPNDLELEAMVSPTKGEILPFEPLTIADNKEATVSGKPAQAAGGQLSTVGALPSREPAAEQPADDPLDQGEESRLCRFWQFSQGSCYQCGQIELVKIGICPQSASKR
jgi:hypothetical protein